MSGASLPRLMLVKPDGACHELLDGLCGHGETFRAEVIAEEIEASLDPANEGLVRVVNFCCWLIREVPATSAPRPVYPQQETFGIDIRLCKPRWHETFACREAGIVNSLFR